ncbi:MAG: hypothetical protein ACKPKO_58865, partial [Candidatus Fonsibacter sp.]
MEDEDLCLACKVVCNLPDNSMHGCITNSEGFLAVHSLAVCHVPDHQVLARGVLIAITVSLVIENASCSQSVTAEAFSGSLFVQIVLMSLLMYISASSVAVWKLFAPAQDLLATLTANNGSVNVVTVRVSCGQTLDLLCTCGCVIVFLLMIKFACLKRRRPTAAFLTNTKSVALKDLRLCADDDDDDGSRLPLAEVASYVCVGLPA